MLEELYQADAVDPAQLVAAQAFLAELQQQNSLNGASQQAQIDTVAYNEALRRTLIEREPVTEGDLAQLAWARADSIQAALADIDIQLVQRLQREGDAKSVQLDEGRVPLSLSLSALGN